MLVKLLIAEPDSRRQQEIWNNSERYASRLCVVETRSALAAARKADRLTDHELERARLALARLLERVSFVEVDAELVDVAAELAEAFALRGYDAVQLASMLTLDEGAVFATTDGSLVRAARLLGLRLPDSS